MKRYHSQFLVYLRRVSKFLLLVFLVLWAATSYYKDKLPEPAFYHSLFPIKPPKQTQTLREPWIVKANKQRYLISPKYDYGITGVVVTGTKAGQFGDIWHYRHWKDYINTRDLCVIWGENVSSGSYLHRTFSSDTWTCWVSARIRTKGDKFTMRQLSNNHLLTASEDIKRRLLQVEKGDVIQIKGWLVDYRNFSNGFYRKTSTIRTDSGNGACETVFIDSFKLIKKANPYLRALNFLSFYMSILLLVVVIVLAVMTPLRND